MTSRLHVLILAGGAGRRLGPWSRPGQRKPELPLAGVKTPLEESIETALTLVPPERMHLVAAEGYISQPGPCQIVSEPRGRNTLPAVAMGVRKILAEDPGSVALVLPADHHIVDRDLYRAGLHSTCLALLKDPDQFWIHGTEADPDPAFGCVICEEDRLIRFVEKPDVDECSMMTEAIEGSGLNQRAYRHCGIFGFGAQFLIDSLNERDGSIPDSLPELSLDHYLLSDRDFFDHLRFRPLKHRWSDLGNWKTIRRFRLHAGAFGTELRIHWPGAADIPMYPGGAPVVCGGMTPEVEGTISKRLVSIGMPKYKVIQIENGYRIEGVESVKAPSPATILFNSTSDSLEIDGIGGGLVACMTDLLVICSEEALGDGSLQSASGILDTEMSGQAS